MFNTLSHAWPADKDLPARAFKMQMLHRVLDGTIYDILKHGFDSEENSSGEYIPLRNRRPSVQFNVARSAISDAAAMLFSEGHFPTAKHADKQTRSALAQLIKETNLNEVYLEAVLKGAPGSVMVLMRVLRGRVFVSAHATTYLTPTWDPLAPDTLLAITEKYKVKGRDLVEAGYEGSYEPQASYWIRTIWDRVAETTFLPAEVLSTNDEPIKWVADPERTVRHGLGFVPASWVKNLPGGDFIDGEPTMRNDAINTGIELDYLLSQNGRGLKYNLDPKLVVKEPPFQDNRQAIEGMDIRATPLGGGNTITLAVDGDAKLLELTGGASEAAVEFAKYLRELALESLKGNRASAEKLATAQSGKAMELMNQPLINLADCLRITYGEKSLQDILQMFIVVSGRVKLVFKNGEPVGELVKGNIALAWPAWYSPTPDELQKKVQTVGEAVGRGLMSQESAVRYVADLYDIEDVEAELVLIKANMAAMLALEVAAAKSNP